MGDFYLEAARQRQNELAAERQAALADLAAHRANGDTASAAQAVQQLANNQAEEQNLQALCNDYLQQQQGPQRPYVSEEARAARRPEEMDQEDMAQVMNQSRYSGKGFTAQDYDNLRRGLGSYKTLRGTENK